MQKKNNSPFSSSFPLKQQIIAGVTVFYENSTENLTPYFSPQEAKEYACLLEEAQINPQKAYPKALAWKEKKDNHPALDNLLTFLHLQHKEVQKAEELIEQSYKNFPKYLFAKINYADQCLRKKQKEQIPHIFPCYELSKLFPDKKAFHVSEFRGFMIILARYHHAIKQKEEARKYYEYAYTADPAHPSLILLEKKLFNKICFRKSLLLFLQFFKVIGKNFKRPFSS